jgi:tetratricopeptide (TPR) repeat protein
MMLGTGFAGGQLLEMFFGQYMRPWTEDPPRPSKFKGRIGRSGSTGQGITFYPGEPKSFRGSAEEKEYIFTINTPDTEAIKKRIAELERLTHAQPANEETYAELAYRYTQQGRWVEAAKVLQQAGTLGFSGATLEGLWGRVLGEMGRHEEAIEHLLQAVTLEPDSGFRRTALGIGLFQLGRKADAVGEFRRALGLEPTNLEFQRNLAVALSETNEDVEQAISLFQTVLAANPDNALALFKLGRLLEQVGQKEEANRCFETATTVPSADVDAFVELGLYRAREGNQSAAVAAFERALELKKSPDIYSLLGGSFVGLDRMEEAAAFREAHRLGPNHQRCLAQLGAILGRRGALDEAMPLLERAVALDPKDEQSRHHLRLLKMRPSQRFRSRKRKPG